MYNLAHRLTLPAEALDARLEKQAQNIRERRMEENRPVRTSASSAGMSMEHCSTSEAGIRIPRSSSGRIC